ncbi:hypothetical protein EPO04_03930 [Patescibacteria group bacterium]|nr:MAG: hypothetical protein EPO04_03930 [Patescibacteria group bacterium]
MVNDRVRAAIVAGLVIFGALFQFLPHGVGVPKAHAASFQFTPTAGQLVTGTAQNATSQATANAEGVNVGSYKGTLADDNFHWTFASTTSGYDANLTFGGAAANGANTLIVETEFDLDATAPSTAVQICDWSSSSSVDNAADSACTGGGWRTLNNRKTGITTTSSTAYNWQIGDGYWSNGSNTSISTPITNFINSSNQIKVRFYSTTNTTSTVAIDYVKVQAVINPVYAPGGFVNDGPGATTGDYTNTNAINQGASDNQYVQFDGTAGGAPAGYFVFKNVKTYTGMNTVMARYETACSSATSLRYRAKIRNFQSSTWEDMAGLVDCSTTDATNTSAKNNVTLSNYISGSSEIWVRFEGDANSTNGIKVDQMYIQLGSTNTSTSDCQVSFGTQTAGRMLSNPSTNADVVNDTDVDSNSMYSVGYDSVGGDREWRIEKRDKTTGALDGSFGTSGVVQTNPSSGNDEATTVKVDGSYVYVGGYDNSPGNDEYRVEKRDKTTGALVTAFDSDGIFTSNPGSGSDQIMDIDIDGSYIYIIGSRSTFVARYEKIDITTGAYDTGFDSDGILESSGVSTNRYDPKAIKVDASYIYTIGTESNSLGATSSQQIRIEKRSLTSGAFDGGFGSGGYANSNPTASDADRGYDIAIDASNMYLAEMQGTSGDYRWRIEKRALSNGALDGTFGSATGAVSYNFSGADDEATTIKVDANGIYVGGRDGDPTSTWRIAKLNLSTGALDTSFGADGYSSSQYLGDSLVKTVAIDASYIYITGPTDSDADAQWMFEKHSISSGDVVSSGFGATDCSATRTIDTTSSNTDTWRQQAENESATQGHDYYAYDNDNDGNAEEAAAANLSFPATLPTSAQTTGVFYAGRFNGGMGDTVQLGAKDYTGRNNVTGGWTATGATATSGVAFTDNISGGTTTATGLQANASAYVDSVNSKVNLRLRTTAGGAQTNDSVHDLDFAMVSVQWVENAQTPTRSFMFAPTGGTLVTGTEQNVLGASGSSTEGTNTGSWKGTLSSDSYHWVVASTASGMNVQLDTGGVALNGANAMMIETKFDQDATVPQTVVQVCDWVSTASVDNAADAQCTGGGWRTLNNRKNPTDTAVGTVFTWQIYDGYWNDGTNTAVSTPLGNFLNGSNSVKVRYYSTTNTTSTFAIDYLAISPVVNSVYNAGGFTNLGSGSVSGTYSNTNNFIGANAGFGGNIQQPSDDTRLTWAGTAGSIADGYLTFKNIKIVPGMNTIAFRAEHRCSTTGINYRPKIYNYTTASWEDLSTSSIACSATDATSVFAKNSVNLRDYVNNGEARLGWYGLSNGTQSIEIDTAYIMVGAVNSDNTTCSISFGTQNAGSCDNTRNIDTTASASTWDILAEDTSTNQGHDFYPFDPQVTASASLEAKAAHVKFPVYDLINGSLVGFNWSSRYQSGTGGTVTLDVRDYSGKSNVEGGFKNVGSPVTSALVYVDSISITAPTSYSPYMTNPEDHREQLTGQSWFRLRTTANSSSATNAVGQWDFAMIAPMWIETSTYQPDSDEQMRHGKYFRNGVEQPMVQ